MRMRKLLSLFCAPATIPDRVLTQLSKVRRARDPFPGGHMIVVAGDADVRAMRTSTADSSVLSETGPFSCVNPTVIRSAFARPWVRGQSLELHLEWRWFVFEPWKAVLAATVDLVRRTHSSHRIVVPPMSEAWLQEHATDFAKHVDHQTS